MRFGSHSLGMRWLAVILASLFAFAPILDCLAQGGDEGCGFVYYYESRDGGQHWELVDVQYECWETVEGTPEEDPDQEDIPDYGSGRDPFGNPVENDDPSGGGGGPINPPNPAQAAQGGKDGSSECEDPPGSPDGDEDDCPPIAQEESPTDPVDLRTGEFYTDVEDLRIQGVGLDFIWTRRYLSRASQSSAIGILWDYSYNIWLRPEGFDRLVHDGHGRNDVYTRTGGTGAWTDLTQTRELRQIAGTTRYELIFENGGKWIFGEMNGTTHVHPITHVIDPNGNTLQFAYHADGRLQTVFDTMNRPISVEWNAAGFIESITDFAGRQVVYTYYDDTTADGGLNDLATVRSPLIVGTSNGNDFPQGRLTRYTYTKGFSDNRLNHNLLTITNARANDPGDTIHGTGPYLVNHYGEGAPADVSFDRVTWQEWAGGDVMLSYARLPGTGALAPATQLTIVNDRAGNVAEYYYGDGDLHQRPGEEGNDLVRIRRFTGRAVPGVVTTMTANRPANRLRADDPAFFESRFQYNDLGLQVSSISSDMAAIDTRYKFDVDPATPPRQRGAMVHRMTLEAGTWDPDFQVEESFEYEGEALYGCECPVSPTAHVDGRGHVTRVAYDSNGNRRRVTHRIAGIVEDEEYWPNGQLRAHVHPDNGSGYRRRDEYEYYGSGTMAGYLEREIVDANGLRLVTTYTYTPWGDVESVTDPKGNVTIFERNALGEIVRKTSPRVSDAVPVKYETAYWHDAEGNVVRMDRQNRDGDGTLNANAWLTTTYEFGLDNELRSRTEEVDATRNVRTELGYDANYNVSLLRLGEAVAGRQPANTLHLYYDERDLLLVQVRAQGTADESRTRFGVDHHGRPTRVESGIGTDPAVPSRVTTFEYDIIGRRTKVSDPMGNVWRYTHDKNGNIETETFEGELVDYEGSGGNRPLAKAIHGYDDLDREITTRHWLVDPSDGTPLGRDGSEWTTTTTTWTDASQIETVTDDNLAVTTHEYDGALRLLATTDPAGNEVRYVRDANGNVETARWTEVPTDGSPASVITKTRTFDGLNRLTSVKNDLWYVERWVYDSRDNLVSNVDRRGNATFLAYDGLDRNISETRELRTNGYGSGSLVGQIVTHSTWDDSGRLVARTDDNSNVTSFIHDALGRPTRTEYADGTVEERSFNAHDEVYRTTDANGTVVDATLDLLGRPTKRQVASFGASPSIDTAYNRDMYSYDSAGRVVRAQSGDVGVLRKHDSLGRIIREEIDGVATERKFDGAGNLTWSRYPSGREITRRHDGVGRLTDVLDDAGLLVHYEHAGVRRPSAKHYRNGTTTKLAWDAVGRPRSVRTDGPAGMLAFHMTAYDPDDNLVLRTRFAGKSQQVTYDSASRMVGTRTQKSGATTIIGYELDGVDNRVSVTGGAHPGAYVMDASQAVADFQANQYTSTPRGARIHDDNGNLYQYQDGGSTFGILHFDFNNRLTMTGPATLTGTIRNRYDAFGRLVGRQGYGGAGFVEKYYYDGDRIAEIRDNAGQVLASFVHGANLDEVLSMRRQGQDYYLHQDDQDSPIAVTDAAGALVERVEYEDFGIPSYFDSAGAQVPSSISGLRFLFAGLFYDAESSFYYARSRWVDPREGVFISRDSIGIWGDANNLGNGTAFVGHNPFTWVDPYGLEGASLWAHGWAFIKGFVSGLGSGLKGMVDSAVSTIRDPKGTAIGLYEGVKGLVGMLAEGDLKGLAQTLEPDIARLILCWKQMEELERTELIGKIVAEKGLDAIMSALGGIAAKLGEKALDFLKGVEKALPCSVVAGTVVATASGPLPIEEVDLGLSVEPVLAPRNPAGSWVHVGNGNDGVAVEATLDSEDGGPTRVRFFASREEAESRGWVAGSRCWLSFGETGSRSGTITSVRAIAASPDEWAIAATIEHPAERYVEVMLADGNVERLTPSQRLWSLDRSGWVIATSIRDDERMLARQGEQRVAFTRLVDAPVVAWDIDVAGADAYVLDSSGLVVHNCNLGPDYFKPGPHAVEGIPGHRGPPTAAEQRRLNELMEENGCHHCGTHDPGTRSGNAIGDHQPPQSLDEPTHFFPHCIDCMRHQGGHVAQEVMRRRRNG